MSSLPAATEYWIDVDGARLFVRDIGVGPAILVLHGGPDFSHDYLTPELDRLARSFRLIYYDQRGRGRSAEAIVAADVSIETEMDDIDALCRHLHLDAATLLGHSWGGLLALEHAVRRPGNAAQLVLINSAPVSASGWRRFRATAAARRTPTDAAQMAELAARQTFAAGDVTVEAEFLRHHFRPAIADDTLLDAVVERIGRHRDRAGLLLARSIERRLYTETVELDAYNLIPDLHRVRVPTLVTTAPTTSSPSPSPPRSPPRSQEPTYNSSGAAVTSPTRNTQTSSTT